jgi:metal-responsive CopG/Arc/MetJ family transcriptional regulator
MSKTKIAITLEQSLLSALDKLVREARFPNRSQAIEEAIGEKLERLDRKRLAAECAKLDPKAERKMAEEGIAGELHDWPEY